MAACAIGANTLALRLLLGAMLASGGASAYAEPAVVCAPESAGVVVFKGERDSAEETVCVELAVTPREMSRGLMFREPLRRDHGMLFLLEPEQSPALWMKNMRFALDVVLISADGRVVAVGAGLPPCGGTACPVYRFPVAAKYVLEVTAGLLDRHPLPEGTRVEIRLQPP